MSKRSAWLRQVRRALAERLDRLHVALESLSEKLRESVSLAVGQAVGGAVHDAVQAAIEGHATDPPRDRRYGPRSERVSLWEEEYAWRRDPYDYPPDEEYAPEDEDRLEETPVPDVTVKPRRQRWLRALAAGLQALAWLLRRPAGRVSFLAASGVGLLAVATAYVTGPLLTGSLQGLLRLGGAVGSVAASLVRS